MRYQPIPGVLTPSMVDLAEGIRMARTLDRVGEELYLKEHRHAPPAPMLCYQAHWNENSIAQAPSLEKLLHALQAQLRPHVQRPRLFHIHHFREHPNWVTEYSWDGTPIHTWTYAPGSSSHRSTKSPRGG